MYKVLVLLLITLLCASPVAAEVYKWRDGNGRMHFSDRPPMSGQQAEEVRVRKKAPPAAEKAAEEEPVTAPASEPSADEAAVAPGETPSEDGAPLDEAEGGEVAAPEAPAPPVDECRQARARIRELKAKMLSDPFNQSQLEAELTAAEAALQERCAAE